MGPWAQSCWVLWETGLRGDVLRVRPPGLSHQLRLVFTETALQGVSSQPHDSGSQCLRGEAPGAVRSHHGAKRRGMRGQWHQLCARPVLGRR